MFTSQIRVEGGNCIEVMLPSQQTFARGCCGTEDPPTAPRSSYIYQCCAVSALDVNLFGICLQCQ